MRCLKFGVQAKWGIYIGKQCNLKGGRNILIGDNVSIRPFCDLFAEEVDLEIGDCSDIGARTRISGRVVIREKVLISPDVYISSDNHIYTDVDRPIMDQGTMITDHNGHHELSIGKGTWIGIHSVIIGDVHIGENCIVGANSVVTKDLPDYCVAAGMPAKVIKKYDVHLKRWEKVSSKGG